MPTTRPPSPVHPAVTGLALLALVLGLGIVDWRLAAGPAALSASSRAASSGSVALGGGDAGTAGQAPFSVSGGRRLVIGAGARRGAAAGPGAAGQASTGTTFDAAAPGGGTGAGPAGPASGTVPEGASTALAAYVDGLTHFDPQEVVQSSDGGPLALAGVVLDAEAINAGRGAVTTVSPGQSSLVPTAIGSSSVTYGGSLTLTTTISGSQGTRTLTDSLAGPLTVSDESGAWRVTGFRYDDQPVLVWNVNRSQTVDGLTVDFGYLVSFGDTTASLVTLDRTSGSSNVDLQAVTLEAGGVSESGVGDFTGPPTPTGVLRFPRAGGPPRSVSLSFSTSDGQPLGFSFTLP